MSNLVYPAGQSEQEMPDLSLPHGVEIIVPSVALIKFTV